MYEQNFFSKKTIKTATLICVMLMFSNSLFATNSLVINNITIINPANQEAIVGHIIVKEDTIDSVKIGSYSATDETALIIEGKNKYAIPGLIDAHVHLATIPGMLGKHELKYTDVTDAYFKQVTKSYLYFGFTTIVDVDVTEPKKIARLQSSKIRPDILTCGGGIIAKDGYPSHYIPIPYRYVLMPNYIDLENKKQTAKSIITNLISQQVSCAKVYHEAGFDTDTVLPTLTLDTIKNIVTLTKQHNIPVFLHANSLQAHKVAAHAQVDVVVHGLWNWGKLDGEQELPKEIQRILDKLLANNTRYQPSLRVLHGLIEIMDEKILQNDLITHVIPNQLLNWYGSQEGQWFAQELLAQSEDAREQRNITNTFITQGERALRYIATQNSEILSFGSDTPSAPVYTNLPGLNGYLELRHWHRSGVSLPSILKAATINNAKLLKMEHKYGSIEKEKVANILILTKNPYQTIDAYDSIDTVILQGKPYPRNVLSAKKHKVITINENQLKK